MSHSRLAIYDLTIEPNYSPGKSNRSVLIQRKHYEHRYVNNNFGVEWDETEPPFPTPLIYLKQKRP